MAKAERQANREARAARRREREHLAQERLDEFYRMRPLVTAVMDQAVVENWS